jgi:hypothetical protein
MYLCALCGEFVRENQPQRARRYTQVDVPEVLYVKPGSQKNLRILTRRNF